MAIIKTKWFANDQGGAPACSGQAGTLLSILSAILVDGFNLLTLDSLIVSGNVATGTKASHGYKVNQVILISGASPAALNGEWRIASVTSGTFTFATSGISDQTATGTITAKAASAGWLKPFTGTNLASFKSQDVLSSQLSVRVDDSSAQHAAVVGAESLTDISALVNSFGTHYFKKSSTSDATVRAWVAVADTRGLYIGIAWSGTSTFDFYHFGDFDSIVAGDGYAFRLQGLLNSAPASIGHYASVSEAAGNQTVNYSVAPRAYSQIFGAIPLWQSSMPGAIGLYAGLQAGGSNVFAMSGNHGYAGTSNLETYPPPNAGDNGLHFFPVFLTEGAVNYRLLRGVARGLLHVFESLPAVSGNYQVISGVENVNGGLVLLIRSAGHTAQPFYPQTVIAFALGDW